MCCKCYKKSKFKVGDRVKGNNEYIKLFSGERLFSGIILELESRHDCGEIATICVNGERRHINVRLLTIDHDCCCPSLAERIFSRKCCCTGCGR